ncbi:MAG: hypothetical protein PVG70_04490 [Desulfobacterales bacterium]|jgi:hypothetical protein
MMSQTHLVVFGVCVRNRVPQFRQKLDTMGFVVLHLAHIRISSLSGKIISTSFSAIRLSTMA